MTLPYTLDIGFRRDQVWGGDMPHVRLSQSAHRAFYRTGVQPETPTFGVRLFDTYRISTANLVLTLLILGLNKRWHFRDLPWKIVYGIVGQWDDDTDEFRFGAVVGYNF